MLDFTLHKKLYITKLFYFKSFIHVRQVILIHFYTYHLQNNVQILEKTSSNIIKFSHIHCYRKYIYNAS